jgi:hypothetical protein
MYDELEKTLNRSVEASFNASPRHWAGRYEEYREKSGVSRPQDRNFNTSTPTTKQN